MTEIQAKVLSWFDQIKTCFAFQQIEFEQFIRKQLKVKIEMLELGHHKYLPNYAQTRVPYCMNHQNLFGVRRGNFAGYVLMDLYKRLSHRACSQLSFSHKRQNSTLLES
jgi:hypothetical protein